MKLWIPSNSVQTRSDLRTCSKLKSNHRRPMIYTNYKKISYKTDSQSWRRKSMICLFFFRREYSYSYAHSTPEKKNSFSAATHAQTTAALVLSRMHRAVLHAKQCRRSDAFLPAMLPCLMPSPPPSKNCKSYRHLQLFPGYSPPSSLGYTC